MKENRWNTFSLSLAAKVPQPTIYRTLKGRTIPTIDTLQRICNVLGLRIDDVLIPDDKLAA
jgi:DNA-binding phage protein